MTHLSLFSGIGGIDLAAEQAGYKTIGQCEWADYPSKVLEKHWPNVPRWKDIRTLTKESFIERTELSTVNIISGGFPCQPFSRAGHERGKSDERYLWGEMVRVINELRPEWVLGENVAGLLSIDNGRTFDEIVESLEDIGYEVMPIVSSAYACGAAFDGKRVFIIATSKSSRHGRSACKQLRELQRKLVSGEQEGRSVWGETERRIIRSIQHKKAIPEDLRGNYGLSDWLDRIKCLGNAVVPQQVYPIFKAIAELEIKDGKILHPFSSQR